MAQKPLFQKINKKKLTESTDEEGEQIESYEFHGKKESSNFIPRKQKFGKQLEKRLVSSRTNSTNSVRESNDKKQVKWKTLKNEYTDLV